MPEISDPEWDQLDELFGSSMGLTFHAIPGHGDLWHIPAKEMLDAVELCRVRGAEQAKKALLR